MDAQELQKEEDREADEEGDNEANNFANYLGDDEDGAYYEEDRDDDFND